MMNASKSLVIRSFMYIIGFMFFFAALLFVSAGSLNFLAAWLFLCVFSAALVLVTCYFLIYDPKLVENRISVGPVAEHEPNQKIIQTVIGSIFLALTICSGLDYRFGWSHISFSMIISANLCVILGFGIIFLVFKVNSYTSSIVIVKEGQFVVTTGPYAVVRHPMYAGSLLMIFFMPIALGSWVGLVFAVLFALLVIVRLLDEEKFLIKNLPGYREYIQKTRFRLVPYVW